MKLNMPFFPFAVLVPLRDRVPNADGLDATDDAATGISLGLIIISDGAGSLDS